MSKKHMGSSPGAQGGCRVATRRGDEEKENIQEQDGHAAEDEPDPG